MPSITPIGTDCAVLSQLAAGLGVIVAKKPKSKFCEQARENVLRAPHARVRAA